MLQDLQWGCMPAGHHLPSAVPPVVAVGQVAGLPVGVRRPNRQPAARLGVGSPVGRGRTVVAHLRLAVDFAAVGVDLLTW